MYKDKTNQAQGRSDTLKTYCNEDWRGTGYTEASRSVENIVKRLLFEKNVGPKSVSLKNVHRLMKIPEKILKMTVISRAWGKK